MDGEWSDGAAASGGEQKARRGDGVSADSSPAGSPPAAPSTTSAQPSGRRRSLQKRVVTVPLADVSVPRPKGVGEGNTPTDSWAWRKYGQKPIKGSPFPRAYYRCSSSKGCPARKQVERSQADPDMVLVTYSYDHNHSSAVARTHSRPTPQKAQNKEQPAPLPEQPADQSDHTHQQGAAASVQVQLVPDSRPAPAAIEVHDEFRWLYDVVSVTSSTSPSDVEEADDMLMYGPMFFGKAAVGTAALLPDEFGDVLGVHEGTTSEEDAMFAGLGELPECAMVFRRNGLLAGGVKVEQPAEGTAMT